MNRRRLVLAVFCGIQLAVLLGILCFATNDGSSAFVDSTSAVQTPRTIPRRLPHAEQPAAETTNEASRAHGLRELRAIEGNGKPVEQGGPAGEAPPAAELRSHRVRLRFRDVVRPTPESQLVAVLIRTDGTLAISAPIDASGASSFEEVPSGRYSVEVRAATDPLESEIGVEPGDIDCLGGTQDIAFDLRCRARSPADR